MDLRFMFRAVSRRRCSWGGIPQPRINCEPLRRALERLTTDRQRSLIPVTRYGRLHNEACASGFVTQPANKPCLVLAFVAHRSRLLRRHNQMGLFEPLVHGTFSAHKKTPVWMPGQPLLI